MEFGKVIGGSASDKLLIRVKSSEEASIGDIVIVKDAGCTYFVKIVNVLITSQLPRQFIEDIAGQKLEHDVDINLFDEEDRFYRLCEGKVLKVRTKEGFKPPRSMPHYFCKAVKPSPKDFEFLKDKGEVRIGYLRLGNRIITDFDVALPAEKLISHHVLVSAATGKGKSNFAKVFVSGLLSIPNISSIVLDPHNEYYGSKGIKGLRDHKERSRIEYFTPRAKDFPGSESLRIHATDLSPGDFYGVVRFSDAQQQAMDLSYRTYGRDWVNNLLTEKNIKEIVIDLQGKVIPATIASLKRKLLYVLELDPGTYNGLVFTLKERIEASLFEKVKRAVLEGKVVIIDTSLVGFEAEKLVASSIVRKIFSLYRRTKQLAPEKFETLPELMILFEEAPRVLGREVLTGSSNIFSRIAREGRKFKVGLCAITQMPSLLSREILSQMNTKIILGIPSPADRQAVIDSSAQDISDESAEIQMLDRGEAIITSPFIDFPMPLKIYLFDDLVKHHAPKKKSYADKSKNSELNIGIE